MRLAFIVVLCGLLAVTGGVSFCGADATIDKAPHFTLQDLNKKDVSLTEVIKGGPTLVTFWSTWCKNCPEEMKHFQRMYDKYKDQGFTVLAVSVDCSKTVAKVRPWVMGRRFSYPVLYDTKNDVKRLYRVGPVPHSFLINEQGEIAFSHVGYRPGDEAAYEREIQKLLKPKAATES